MKKICILFCITLFLGGCGDNPPETPKSVTVTPVETPQASEETQAETPEETEAPDTILGKTENEWITWHNALQRELENEELICEAGERSFDRVEVLDVSEDSELIQITCNVYAYQADFIYYHHAKKAPLDEEYFGILSFEEMVGEKLRPSKRLVGVFFDKETKILESISKGRGLGDCGTAAKYQWNKNSGNFELTEYRKKADCDGDIESDWPVVYPYKGNGESILNDDPNS